MAIVINNANKKEELAQLKQLQTEIDILLSDPNLDPAIKEQVVADISLTQSTIQADNMTSRDARQYTLGVYKGILEKLSGNQGYSESMVGGATKNIFGSYSNAEKEWMANETLKRSAQSANTVGSRAVVYDPISASPKTIHIFDPTGVDQEYRIAGTKKDKAASIKAFASYLTNVLEQARTVLSDSNNSYQGWDKANNNKIDEWVNTLSTVGTGSEEDLNTQILSMGKMVNSIKNPNIQEVFEGYFGTWLEGFSESDARIAAEQAEKEANTITINGKNMIVKTHPNDVIKDILDNHGWKTAYDKDSDSYYVYGTDSDGTLILIQSKEYVELDPTKEGVYQHGLIVGEDGKLYFGNLTEQSFIDEIGRERFGQIAAKIKQAHKNHWPIQDLSSMNLGIGVDFSDYLADLEGENRAIIFADPRVAGTEDFPLWIDYDTIFKQYPDWKTRFKYNGYADVDVSGESTANQYLKSKGVVEELNIPTDIPELNNEYAYTYFIGNKNRNGDINGSKSWFDYTISTFYNVSTPEEMVDKLKKHIAYNLLIYEGSTRSDWAKEQISLLTDGKAFEEVEIDGKKVKIGTMLMKQLYNDGHMEPILISIIKSTDDPEVRQRAIQELKALQERKASIQKGQDGLSIDYVTKDPMSALGVSGTPSNPAINKLRMLSLQGYDVKKQRTKGFTDDEKAALWWMLGSAALDISSMFTGGYAAGGLGLGSMVTDIIADTKMGLPARNVAGNALNNFGWAAIGMVPLVGNLSKSAKVAKIGTNIGKLMSRIGIGYGALAELLGAKESAALLEKWCTAPNTMTVEDYRHLAMTLRTATGIASGAKGHRTLRKTDVVDVDPRKHVVITDNEGNVTTKAVSQADFDKATSSDYFWRFWKRRPDMKAKTQSMVGEGNTAHTTPTLQYGIHTSDLHTVNQQAAIDRALWVTQKQKTGATTWVGKKWQKFRNAGLPDPTVPYESQQAPDIYWFQGKRQGATASATTSISAPSTKQKVEFQKVSSHQVTNGPKYTMFKVKASDFDGIKTEGITNVVSKDAQILTNPEAFGLPKGSKAIFDPVKKTVIYADPLPALPQPSTNKQGGKLTRLNNYLTNN